MSAIGKMKAELTRHGVEYDFTDRLHEVPSYQSVTWWFNTADKARFLEYHDGSTQLIVRSIKSGVTPEEAIAATLGPCNCTNDCTNSERTGTCELTDNGPWGYPYVCSACGASFDADVNGGDFNFCPNCGRRIKED